MSYGTHTFWDIYLSFGLHPICGTVVVVIAFAGFIAGTRDHPERRLFWVATILVISLLGYWVGEWDRNARWINFNDAGMAKMGGGIDPDVWQQWIVGWTQARMMFLAQGGLALTFALGLLWWPIRLKE